MSTTLNFVTDNDSHSHEIAEQHLAEKLEDIIGEVSDVIAPVWPLRDYVAVNPYAGLSYRSFMDARAFLKVFSDCETLLPIEHYAVEFQQGRFSIADIESALMELRGIDQPLMGPQIAEQLMSFNGRSESTPVEAHTSTNLHRPIRTIAEYATASTGVNWTEAIVEEVSKHCSAHYDRGQTIWGSPYKHLSLYQAWRKLSEYDRNIEILGLTNFRAFANGLPHTPEAAIVYSLDKLQVPVQLWSAFLLCQAFSIPGWSAWCKYQTHWTVGTDRECKDLTELLAIRLAYDAALAEAKSLQVNWDSLLENGLFSCKTPWAAITEDSTLRYVLLRASEIGYRNRLLRSLLPTEAPVAETAERKLAQLVFCIDVRSERLRRQLESQSSDIETFGFAGFFGMAFEYLQFGEAASSSQMPVLLQPQFKIQEGLLTEDPQREAIAVRKHADSRAWQSYWKSFQASAVGCFSFVETTGLFQSVGLLRRTLGLKPKIPAANLDCPAQSLQDELGPNLRGLPQQGMCASRQADLAEGLLRNLGLTKNFAHLIVFCGHASQTDNNPLAASLDCGACGGHSGESNARLAALLLNQFYIRKELYERGIAIPDDTHFIGAVHNTTTDVLTFFDLGAVPDALRPCVQEVKRSCELATQQTQLERLPVVASESVTDLLKRASDWSEVRPEWGLAGNAAFIVGPRSLSKHVHLEARAFLHSYDHKLDVDGKVLETIMTAPMIVANWINLQYYASSVDNCHFGSGNKTIHNVVGRFGILSGNGGDLQTGLPWQSLHTGQHFQHAPLRLQVVIAAPRAMIDRVITKHETVANLVDGAWLHLVAIDDGCYYRYAGDRTWEQFSSAGIDCQIGD